MIYAVLFVVGFLNEILLTSYYIAAARGHRWKAVGLCIAVEAVRLPSAALVLSEALFSREQLLRAGVLTLSYAIATAIIVKPELK